MQALANINTEAAAARASELEALGTAQVVGPDGVGLLNSSEVRADCRVSLAWLFMPVGPMPNDCPTELWESL